VDTKKIVFKCLRAEFGSESSERGSEAFGMEMLVSWSWYMEKIK